MPARLLPMWSFNSASRLAFLGFAIMFAAIARAAEPHVDPPAGAALPPGFALAVLDVTVNREQQDEPIIALRDGAGRVFVAAADLARWRLRLPEAAPVLYQAERYYPLAAYNGLVAHVDERAQTLSIEAPPAMFAATQIDATAPPVPVPQRSAVGGFLNYTLLATRADTATTGAGSFELGAFGRWGSATTTAVASTIAGKTDGKRLESTWTYAMPDRLATVRAGDTVNRAGAWGNAVRYGGVQYATDFATQPNLVLTPGQFVAGQATVPSTVDVFVNNALVTQQSVKPGPFDITNIPPITGPGNVTLVVRDELGREQVITRPFYASPVLLRAGLTDFSYDLGLVRENFGIASNDYGPWVASGTYRRGISDRWTGEVRAETQAGLANAGIASDVLIDDFGVFSASAAGGRNPLGSGSRVSLGFDRQALGLSFNVQGALASPHFRLVGDTESQGVVARQLLASAGYTFGRYGTLSVAYVARSYRDQPSTTIGSLGYSFDLGRWGYVGVSMSRVRAGDRSTQLDATWTLPLGTSTSAALSIDRVRSTAPGADHDERALSIQRDLPLGEGFGYRLRASDQGPRQAEIDYQNRYGTYSAVVAQAQGKTGERVSASGGVGLIGSNVFLSRTINDSFGLVRLPGYPDVRVYSENQEIGRTNAAGELVVPRLLPYQKNTVRIEQGDLPFDAEFDVLARDAVPYARSGVMVEFGLRPARGAVVKITQDDGAPVPAGARVRVEGQEGTFPVALDGDAYLTGLAARTRAVATWLNHECAFEFDYPETGGPQPRLGPFVCRRLH
jgi:outer membrane usher protein